MQHGEPLRYASCVATRARVRLILVGLLYGFVLGPAHAEDVAPASATVRREVVLRLSPSELAATEIEALAKLLRAELLELGVELRLEAASLDEAAWVREKRREQALLFASVQVTPETGWRVLLFDPDAQRTSARELGGGAGDDAAMIEAVASVLISATSALLQGEELAAPREEQRSSEKQLRPLPEVTEDRPSPEQPTDFTPPALARSFALHLGLGLGAASFDRSEPVTLGPELRVGVMQRDFAIDFGATHHGEARFATDYGAFALARSALSVRGGPLFERGAWILVPELLALVERIERERGTPVAGQSAAPARDEARWSVGAGAELRYRVSDLVLAEAGAWGVYFPEPIRLTADDGRRVLVAPWSLCFVGFVGLGFRL